MLHSVGAYNILQSYTTDLDVVFEVSSEHNSPVPSFISRAPYNDQLSNGRQHQVGVRTNLGRVVIAVVTDHATT